jgi:hypothetical protein
MSIQPRPLLEILPEVLSKMEADPEPTPNLIQLKRILRTRIAELESIENFKRPPAKQ